MKISKVSSLRGELRIPGDKSISHRSVMLGAIAEGDTAVSGFLKSADCLATIDCFRKLGISIEEITDGSLYMNGACGNGPLIVIHGKGLRGLKAPKESLNAMNSGTTVRLLSGILAGQNFTSRIEGDRSLSKRPMKRIIRPLEVMGCNIASEDKNNCLPLIIRGGSLKGIRYKSPVASAQVKSCILLAGLYADAPTFFTEPSLSRNHTELMLSTFGGNLKTRKKEKEPEHFSVIPKPPKQAGASDDSNEYTTIIYPGTILRGQRITVPGDISSAAYFIAAGLITPNSEITLRNVGINETRDGILRVARSMGANIHPFNVRMEGREPVADLIIRSSHLTGTQIGGALIPTLIDELPVIAVMAACAEGKTEIRDASELRVKESDRLASIITCLTLLGIRVEETQSGMIIEGRGKKAGSAADASGRNSVFHGSVIDPQGDHRIAMAFSIAGLVSDTPVVIKDTDCVRISYPDFYKDLKSLEG